MNVRNYRAKNLRTFKIELVVSNWIAESRVMKLLSKHIWIKKMKKNGEICHFLMMTQHQQRCSFQALLPAAEPSQHPEIQIAYFPIILLLFSKNIIEIIVHMSLHKRFL